MTLDDAIKRLYEEYERAKKLQYVKNPIAYSIYSVWKEADKAQKQATDLMFKCGSCAYAKPTDAFRSDCYVECTNAEHLTRYCHRHDISKVRQRTNKACRRYKERD